jgi:hypothetical protein
MTTETEQEIIRRLDLMQKEFGESTRRILYKLDSIKYGSMGGKTVPYDHELELRKYTQWKLSN